MVKRSAICNKNIINISGPLSSSIGVRGYLVVSGNLISDNLIYVNSTLANSGLAFAETAKNNIIKKEYNIYEVI